MATSLVLAEDSFIVREGVRMLLERAGYDLRAAVETYGELMAAVETHQPDVVVTDIRMPPSRTDEGIRAAREIRETHPNIGVVVLSQYVEPAYALALFHRRDVEPSGVLANERYPRGRQGGWRLICVPAPTSLRPAPQCAPIY